MAEEIDALVTFYESWRLAGVGADGLPLYEQVAMLRLAKPPLLQVDRVATDEDLRTFHVAWEAFLRQQAVRDTTIKGYPLSMWPVIAPAELQMCLARDIVTVEQLAALGTKGVDTLPQIRELAVRAKKLIELQGKTGKFETVIHELTIERDAVIEQLKEANGTISAQNSMIAMLQASAAPRQVA